ncbi:TrmH family RNA methyltransferase [Candidatus Saccharibacteria bacterium]|nr:TrmH family RNA methyltransferase [Candidatus Saccharibacteria bacterium]
MPISLLLHNIRSTYNVGSILRTAEGFGVKDLIFSGYTPRYDDTTLLPHLRAKLNHEIAKTALGAEQLLHLQTTDDILTTLDQLKQSGFLLLGLENNLEDPRLRPLDFFHFSELQALFRASQKPHLLLCLGEEVSGIPSELREKMDYFLEIPMQGQKESFNVSVATGIALFALTQLP